MSPGMSEVSGLLQTRGVWTHWESRFKAWLITAGDIPGGAPTGPGGWGRETALEFSGGFDANRENSSTVTRAPHGNPACPAHLVWDLAGRELGFTPEESSGV